MHQFIRLGNGRKFDYLRPKPSDFQIETIAASLSKQCRYVGQTKLFYSIAEHSCRVCDIMPEEFKLEGLMHDGYESMSGDINTILKNILPVFRDIEIGGERQMARRFKLRFPFPPEVKTSDMILLVTEMRDLMPGEDYKMFPFKPLDKIIRPWGIQKAEREFLKRFEKYRRN